MKKRRLNYILYKNKNIIKLIKKLYFDLIIINYLNFYLILFV